MSTTPTPGALKAAPESHLQRDSISVAGIVFLVLAAASPVIGLTGAVPVSIVIGNGIGVSLAYIAIGLVLLLFAVGYVLMSRHVTDAGALYAYAAKGLGTTAGTGVAGIAVYAYTAVQIAIYGFFGAVSTAMVNPLLGSDIPWWAASLALIGVVQVFGYLQLELGAKVLGILLIGEWGVMLAMAASVAIQGGAGEGLAMGSVFSFEALVAGAPGVALMFAFASSLGFEAAAVFGEEVRNPRRSVPKATYVSVLLIMAFFAFTTWMITVGYGPGNVVAEAGKALESGDTASFIYALGDRYLGSWAPVAMSIFVVTSTFAAALAFHNGIARYLFALGRGGVLPNPLGRVHPKSGAPVVASVAQTAGAAGIIAVFALLQADPIAVVFGWCGGIAVIGLLAAYLLVSLSVLVYFRRNKADDANLFNSLVAPALSLAAMGATLTVIILNFNTLVGGTNELSAVLLLSVAAVFVVGVVRARRIQPRDGDSLTLESAQSVSRP
ncbi:APC family permease [Arthrobacter sp. I2-34]|uniref:APC family permease n=1 Tax=Arthrobacter hankyongi TaxID=2904801 RepID=A0ABS9LB52_9MICC|nr:APC family permease [Arthrobacter hankyongi]MCG2623699.1 APC family permease [Arthrobacter hankyongi]